MSTATHCLWALWISGFGISETERNTAVYCSGYLLWVCYLPVVFPVSNQLKTPFLHFSTGIGICLLFFMYWKWKITSLIYFFIAWLWDLKSSGTQRVHWHRHHVTEWWEVWPLWSGLGYWQFSYFTDNSPGLVFWVVSFSSNLWKCLVLDSAPQKWSAQQQSLRSTCPEAAACLCSTHAFSTAVAV